MYDKEFIIGFKSDDAFMIYLCRYKKPHVLSFCEKDVL